MIARILFRSAPPRGGDRLPARGYRVEPGFDPRPREGATPRIGDAVDGHIVSIRAPARGRLDRGAILPVGRRVSIRAPARGRLPVVRELSAAKQFRSAPPRGGDASLWTMLCRCRVSIRAPARGRPERYGLPVPRPKFRSAPPRGGDRAAIIPRSSTRCFDPRPREGATPGLSGAGLARACFDPRPREGATFDRVGRMSDWGVSIRAPARGRRGGIDGRSASRRFRSAPPRGGDDGVDVDRLDRPVSIRAPARGRHQADRRAEEVAEFRSAPPRGGDGAARGAYRRHRVSIRAPARGRRDAGNPMLSIGGFRSAPPRGGDSSG